MLSTKERSHLNYLKRKANYTQEQLLEHKQKIKKNTAKYLSSLSQDKKEQKRLQRNQRQLAKYHALSPEERKKRLDYCKNNYYTLTPEERKKENLRTAVLRLNQKIKVIAYYSNGTNKCAKCGFSDIRALSLDHINGGGREHLRQLGKVRLYDWIIKNNFPEGFQVLCMNDQFIKKAENKEDKPANKKYY